MASRAQVLTPAVTHSVRDQIDCDCILPPDIVPIRQAMPIQRRVLVTGATGFLGRYLVADLLQTTDWSLVCLIRANDEASARDRLNEALAKTERELPNSMERISIVCGDVAQKHFGQSLEIFEQLAMDIHMVIHGAAEVNWIKSYATIRQTNVLGTLHVIQFASLKRAKPFYFLSTLAVCYAEGGPEKINESTNMIDHIEAMPLGYAQSKCVSEVLLREASMRGLPVTIIRPSLICGDSKTGISNEEDIISRVIKGCINLGCAADADWLLDICPVDCAAQIIASVMQDEINDYRILHLHHPNPRHWRELILWMNLFGYSIPLVDLESWFARLDATTRHDCRELFALRPFFLSRPEILKGRRTPELYLESTRGRICSKTSHKIIADRDMALPIIDSNLLGKYFRKFLKSGFVPAVADPMLKLRSPLEITSGYLERLLQQKNNDFGLKVFSHTAARVGTNSIINELSSARSGQEVGIWRHSVSYRCTDVSNTNHVDLLVKVKASDDIAGRIAEAIGGMQSDKLATVAHLLPRILGIARANEREIALYQSNDERLTRHMPSIYAAHGDPALDVWYLVMEYLTNTEMLDSIDTGSDWEPIHIMSALSGLADIHSVWYRRVEELRQQTWIAPEIAAKDVRTMTPLWHALAEFASESFSSAWGVSSLPIQQRMIDSIPSWWKNLSELPRTLIHNDFNPRNLAFRRVDRELQLCAYDWELATIGVPQHDLAELLCFVLPDNAEKQDAEYYIDQYRVALQRTQCCTISSIEWQTGFRLSLRNLIINRFPLYALINKFKPQAFFSKTIRNWYQLHQWFDPM